MSENLELIGIVEVYDEVDKRWRLQVRNAADVWEDNAIYVHRKSTPVTIKHQLQACAMFLKGDNDIDARLSREMYLKMAEFLID